MSVLRDSGDAAKGDSMNRGRKGGTKGIVFFAKSWLLKESHPEGKAVFSPLKTLRIVKLK